MRLLSIPHSKAAIRTWVRRGQYLLAAFALTAAQLGGQYAPWGLGCVAAAGKGGNGLCALAGAVLGAFCFFPFQAGLRYSAAVLLIYCACVTFGDSPLYARRWFRPVCAAALFFTVQFVYFWGRGFSVWLLGLAAAAAAAISAALIQSLLSYHPPRRVSPDPGAGNRTLQKSAEAFHSLYDGLFRPPVPTAPENPAVIFDQAAENVCRTCHRRTQCWQADYNTTFNAFNDACGAILTKKTAEIGDFPAHFVSQCIDFPALLAAINRELQAYLLRRQYRLRLQTTRELAASQYAQMGQILSSASAAVPASASAHALRYHSASALRPKEGEKVCGDQVAIFEVGNCAYFLLSDGMGTGEAAHTESAMTVRLLKQFLKAGIAPTPALTTLNTALRIHQAQSGSFTTIDLAVLDRMTGEVTLYKYGAAPSYCKRGGIVQSLRGQALPAGLCEDTSPPDIRLTLARDQWLVLVSDGMTGTAGDEWLQDLLAGFQGEPELLCAHILSQSRRRGGLQDDCAVIAVHLENSPPQAKTQV